jgi:hypothetical protein
MDYDVTVAAGDRICEDTHGVAGSWVSFAITCGMLLIGGFFGFGAIQPIFQPRLQGEFQAGLAMLALGGIFAGIGVASYLLARHRSRSRVFLHENGVVYLRNAELHFVPFEDCTEFTVYLHEPSDVKVAGSVLKAGLSALAGNAAGVGAAIGATHRRGHVAFHVEGGPHGILNGISMEQLETVAQNASRARGQDVIHRFK